MRTATRVVAAATVLGAVGGAVLGMSRFAGAQSQGDSQAPLPAPTTVDIGTMPEISGTVDARVTTPPGTFLAVAADTSGSVCPLASACVPAAFKEGADVDIQFTASGCTLNALPLGVVTADIEQ